ncbi:MAG: hypothetical protein JO030_04180 [Candidatus Eremiobacteraeota bacterium]|nr:hypothetical protein [Candidatus Eremiobacteraeota bacterium]
MTRSLAAPALAAALLAGSLFCGRFAMAQAASIETLLAGALVPSSAPELLGPITSAGRTGWECKPERAAASARARDAQLPGVPNTP